MSSEGRIRCVLFDVADTLLHKPDLYPAIRATLAAAGLAFETDEIVRAHRLTRELVTAPDETGLDFYRYFNFRFLGALGVAPTEDLAERIYLACRDLPWEPFADTEALAKLQVRLGIVSNWDSSLREKLSHHFRFEFNPVLISAEAGTAKPDARIYQLAIEATGANPAGILFVGDSIHLDIAPALALGVRAVLIDRHGLYRKFNGVRIESLDELLELKELGG